MYLNKITLALFVIYAVINALHVIDLNQRLEVAEVNLAGVKKQSAAATMLLLAHIELHDLEKQKENVGQYNNYDNLLPILPKKKYD